MAIYIIILTIYTVQHHKIEPNIIFLAVFLNLYVLVIAQHDGPWALCCSSACCTRAPAITNLLPNDLQFLIGQVFHKSCVLSEFYSLLNSILRFSSCQFSLKRDIIIAWVHGRVGHKSKVHYIYTVVSLPYSIMKCIL